MKNFLKHLISKIGNGLLISIGFTLGIGIIGIIYATWNSNMTTVGTGSGLTATAWNAMVNNINELNTTKLATNGNGSALTGLTKTQVGLGSVDNIADASKNVLSATKLTTARTINGVSFNGTANITISPTIEFGTCQVSAQSYVNYFKVCEWRVCLSVGCSSRYTGFNRITLPNGPSW